MGGNQTIRRRHTGFALTCQRGDGCRAWGVRNGADDAPSSSILTGLGFFLSAMRWRFNSSSIASEIRFASCSAAIRRSRSAGVSFGGGAIARVRGSSFDVFCRLGAILEWNGGGRKKRRGGLHSQPFRGIGRGASLVIYCGQAIPTLRLVPSQRRT